MAHACVCSVFACGPRALCIAERGCLRHVSTCMCACVDVCTLRVQSGRGSVGGSL